MSEHEKHSVPAADGTLIAVPEFGCPECATWLAIDRALPATAPIDPADEVTQAFAVLRRHLPASLREAEAELEAAWFSRPRTEQG
jgi:hypothetical protein